MSCVLGLQATCEALADASAIDILKACGTLLVPALRCCLHAIGGEFTDHTPA